MAAIEKNRYNCRSIGRLNKLFETNDKSINCRNANRTQSTMLSKNDKSKSKNNIQPNSASNECKMNQVGMDKSQCSSATTAFTMINFQTNGQQRN